MSLVAYNASDESDGEESDEGFLPDSVAQTQVAKRLNSAFGHISDEDEYETVSSTSVATDYSVSSASGTGGTNFIMGLTTPNVGLVDSTSVASLEDLPAPRSNTGVVIQEEDELEDEVKPKPSEIENAQKPPDKKKQPVKIILPSLDKSDDEDENAKRKPAPSLTKSGLFSLLPPPIHSAKKEINRPLIPHTLTKKSPTTIQESSQAKPPKPTQKPNIPVTSIHSSKSVSKQKVALNVAMYGSDSDEEDEIHVSNFFSLDSSKSAKGETLKSVQSEEVSSSGTAQKSSLSEGAHTKANKIGNKMDSSQEEKNGKSGESEAVESLGPELGTVNDAPLDFSCVKNSRLWSSSSSSSSYAEGYLGAVGLAGPIAPSQSYNHGYVASASAQYNMVNAEIAETGPLDDAVGDGDLKQFMSDKEFQRLSGKRKRGLEDAINFVDANVDDYVDPSELNKHLTEDTEYVSHKNKDNMPTAQQRRKKQITYLAYQAKERELELKNTWAQNRMTKKQTQSKYGF